MYLTASLIFFYLAFIYFGFLGKGVTFLITGIVVALYGIKTKKVVIEREKLNKISNLS